MKPGKVCMLVVADMHYLDKEQVQDPDMDLDPHQNVRSDTDPHQSIKAETNPAGGRNTEPHMYLWLRYMFPQ
jgi:hypothetical protein